ncbi:MAG: hypothetical protein ABI721_03465 [Candidatus Dojkabacteria bacterium]
MDNVNKANYTKIRNKKALMLIGAIILSILGSIILVRFFFIYSGNTFGKVNGLFSSPNENDLTQVNFVDSGNHPQSSILSDYIKSPFTPISQDKLWVKFVSGRKTYVGFVDKDSKFTKVYDLPSTIKLIKLLADESILVADEPSKENPTFYYVQKDKGQLDLTTLEFQDTFISIYYEPSEKLFYYLGKDKDNIIYLNSVNEKSQVLSIFKTTNLSEKSRIIYIDQVSTYFQDGINCYQLSFSSKILNTIDCAVIKRNDIGLVYSVKPSPSSVYLSKDGSALSSLTSSEREEIFSLPGYEVISKVSYANNQIIFVKGNLTPINESSWSEKDIGVYSLNLESNQVTEVTQKLPLYLVENYYSLDNKIFAKSQTQGLSEFVPTGFTTTVYLGEALPASYAIVTQYWKPIDFGVPTQNLEILSGDFIL